MERNSIILIWLLLLSACKSGGNERICQIESSLDRDYFSSSFSFYSGKQQEEANCLFNIHIWFANEFFKKDSAIKFIVEKDIRCEGNAAVQLFLEPAGSDSIWSGHLVLELLGVKSAILSGDFRNRITEGDESKGSALYYSETLRKTGPSFSITFQVKVIKDADTNMKEVIIEQMPEGGILKHDVPVYAGRLSNLFTGNISPHDVYLYYHKRPVSIN